jgi:hypothetical protein
MPYLRNSGQLGEFWTDYPRISRSINQPYTNGKFIVGWVVYGAGRPPAQYA